MTWITKLYETYEEVSDNKEINQNLDVYFHKNEQCHIEIILDTNGKFLGSNLLVQKRKYGKNSFWKGENTLIPGTPKSLAGKVNVAAPNPLAEKIQYVAKDYPDYGGMKKSYFSEYFELLISWSKSEKFSHFKVKTIANYVSKGQVVRDLVNAGVLFTYKDNQKDFLITKWAEQGPNKPGSNQKEPKPPLLHAVNGNEQGNAIVRWRVQRPGDPDDSTWNDEDLIEKWQSFQIDQKRNDTQGFCQILGKETYIFDKHPKGINPKVNDAKLISVPTNKSYLTYQGRFTDDKEPCAISFEASQKAHNALRWLISRQGHPIDGQVYVAWAISGKKIPDPLTDSWSLLGDDIIWQPEKETKDEDHIDHSVDIGQHFAHQFNRYLSGYREALSPNEQIVVFGLDSATTGRMSVMYYRELIASEFLDRLHAWHSQFAWPQRHILEKVPSDNKKASNKKKIVWPVSTPIPRLIAETAYGSILRTNHAFKKNVIERIVPCIVDEHPLPKDIMQAAVRRTSNRNIKRLSQQYSNAKNETAEWEKQLGVACALFKGFYARHPDQSKRRKYDMALEEERKSRDYLYGRLLAIAEYIEEISLNIGGENRPTMAARMMQRFADHPFSTWRTIELGMQPYLQRLQGARPGFLANRRKDLDTVLNAFDADDFLSKKSLSGEFLLGYHCQRHHWRDNKSNSNTQNKENNNHESEL